MTLYRAEWDMIIARQFTPLFDEVLGKHLHLFDYDATWDAILRDPYVSDLVIPSEYLTPSVTVTEGDKTTEHALEVTKLVVPPAVLDPSRIVMSIEQ